MIVMRMGAFQALAIYGVKKKQKCVRPWLDKECFPSMNTEKASPPKK